jgi:hypothetical protein
VQINVTRVDIEHVASGSRGQRGAIAASSTERGAQPRYVDGQVPASTGRRVGLPQAVNKVIGSNDRPRRQQQNGEDAADLARFQCPLLPGIAQLDRSEYLEFHDCRVLR